LLSPTTIIYIYILIYYCCRIENQKDLLKHEDFSAIAENGAFYIRRLPQCLKVLFFLKSPKKTRKKPKKNFEFSTGFPQVFHQIFHRFSEQIFEFSTGFPQVFSKIFRKKLFINLNRYFLKFFFNSKLAPPPLAGGLTDFGEMSFSQVFHIKRGKPLFFVKNYALKSILKGFLRPKGILIPLKTQK
jgi:hypothetical protein